jgi:hypothetical protein
MTNDEMKIYLALNGWIQDTWTQRDMWRLPYHLHCYQTEVAYLIAQGRNDLKYPNDR